MIRITVGTYKEVMKQKGNRGFVATWSRVQGAAPGPNPVLTSGEAKSRGWVVGRVCLKIKKDIY